ncbi:glycosyltransferase family 4 protein [Desulfonatronovibrio magnus]|uniref:glycosyltransferase family 4 protein n=1 Tax=Desulfonatronovibrio magnus TaxID=698827 RepID=UPI0005EB1379|nr:glycosyltransferase family 4 protein [Desulfonatronovibrio magnus]
MIRHIWGTLDPFYEAGPFLGRIEANTGFLRALLEADPFDEYHFFVSSEKTASTCKAFIKQNFTAIHPKISFIPRTRLIQCLQNNPYKVFHLSDCINYPVHLALLRNKYSKSLFSITSITHSLSYSSYSHQLLKQLWPGWSAKDAIICSSACGRKVLENYFEHLHKYYRLSADFTHPQLVTIPLGINTEDIASAAKKPGNSNLLKNDKVNILCLGRISCYSKMDVLPILRSFQLGKIYGLNLDSVRLVMAGGVDQKDDTIKKLALFARNIGLELMVFPNPDQAKKMELMHHADIFVSMSDNPQETFGLTILEAGAAELAVVASDYNGYKELIKDQENGFLIPTLGPDSTEFIDDLAPILFDSESHLLLAQSCAVDIHALIKALSLLIVNPDLRKSLGANLKKSVQDYDWSRVIQQYLELWDNLYKAEHRESMDITSHAAHTPYAQIFKHYTTNSWINSVLSLSKLGQAVYKKKDFPVIYAGMSEMIDPQKIRMLLFLSRAPIKSSNLIARLSASLDLSPSVSRILVSWAVKQGLLQTS